MKGKTHLMRLASVLTCLLLLLAGCTEESDRPVVRLSNWGGAGEGNEYDQLVQRFYDDFRKKHNVDLRVEGIPGEYVHKMLLNFVAGTQPDVMVLDASSAAVFINNGLLTDLTPYIEKDPGFAIEDYFPNVVDIARREDKLYAIPGDFTPMVVYYNKDMFDAAGLPYPDGTWSFAEFLEVAKKLTVRDPKNPRRIQRYGFSFTNWMPAWVMWLWNNGGDVLSPDGKTAEGYFNSPANVETISFIRDMIKKHQVAPSLSEIASTGVDLFANGQAAMTVSGHWSLVSYKNAPKGKDGKPAIDWKRLGVAAMPHNTPESYTVMYEAGFAIPKDCKEPELAWELVKMWTGYELQSQYNASGIAVCARKDVAAERATEELEKQFLDIVPTARKPYGSWVEGYEVVEATGKSALDSILNNDRDVAEELTKAAQKIDREFAKR